MNGLNSVTLQNAGNARLTRVCILYFAFGTAVLAFLNGEPSEHKGRF
jgi:hypothetical protein